MYVSEHLRHFDFFGHKVDLLINEKKKFRTTCGGFFSVAHIALCLLVFFTLADNMMYRTNPSIVSTTIFQAEPGPSYFAKDQYFMMFAMQDPTWAYYIDETIYKTLMAQEMILPNGTAIITPIPIERCTPDHIPLSVRDTLIAAVGNVSNLYCIESQYDGLFYLNQVYGEPEYQQITINIEICQNNTKDQSCKTPDEINKKLIGSFFAIQSADFIIDPNNYESPANMFYRHYFVPTSPKMKKMYYRYLKTSYLQSDIGWIFKQSEKTQYTAFDSDRDFFDVYEDGNFTNDATPRQIMYVEIEKSNYETYYIRQYEKIQTVLAQLGGFINVLYITFMVLTYPIKTKLFYDTIANKLFNFEDTEGKDKGKKDDKQNNKNENNDGNKDDKSKYDKAKRIMPHKVTVKKPDYDFYPKDQPIYITFWEDFWSRCKKRSEIKAKIRQRDAAVHNFLEKMDIVFVLKKFLEIEKLKILLLNQDQYHLFDFFPKPFVTRTGHILLDYSNAKKKITNNNLEELSETLIVSNMDKVNKALSVRKAFHNIQEKENRDQIDEKLLKLVEHDIKKLSKEKAHIFLKNMTTSMKSKTNVEQQQ